jgi:predicted dehydrogenase
MSAGVRTAVIGTGGHVQNVLLPTLAAAGLVPVAIAGRRFEQTRAVAQRHGISMPCETVAEACSKADAVVVAVPVDAFESVLDIAIAAGKPIFTEKPAAPDAATARRLHARATAASVPVVVGYMKRFAPAYVRLRDHLSSPDFSGPSLVHVRWTMGPFGDGRPLDDWITENAVHGIDLARFFAGDLHALDIDVSGGPGRYVVLARARAAHGEAVSLQMATTGPWWHDNELVEVLGIGSSARVKNATTFVVRPSNGPEQRWGPNFTIPVPKNLTGELLGFAGVLRAFSQLVREGGPSPCDLEDAACTLDIAGAIIAAGS